MKFKAFGFLAVSAAMGLTGVAHACQHEGVSCVSNEPVELAGKGRGYLKANYYVRTDSCALVSNQSARVTLELVSKKPRADASFREMNARESNLLYFKATQGKMSYRNGTQVIALDGSIKISRKRVTFRKTTSASANDPGFAFFKEDATLIGAAFDQGKEVDVKCNRMVIYAPEVLILPKGFSSR